MKDTQDKVIMYDAPECSRIANIVIDGVSLGKVYVSIDGSVFGSEDAARYRSSTHKMCDCGGIMPKGRTMCDRCHSATQRDRYFKRPEIKWDGKTHLTLYDDDTFFSGVDALEEYCEENDVKASDLMLVICEPNKLMEVESDYWQDIAPEDDDDFLPKEVEEALAHLNEVIKNAPVVSWGPGKFRTSYEYVPESLQEKS